MGGGAGVFFIFGNFLWKFSLGILFGNFLWEFFLGILFGNFKILYCIIPQLDWGISVLRNFRILCTEIHRSSQGMTQNASPRMT